MSDLIEVYARRLRAIGRSPDTISTRCRVLRHAHRWLIADGCEHGLDSADDDNLVEYLGRARETRGDGGLMAWSQTTAFSHLRGYYTTMVEIGRLTVNPTDYMKRPEAGDALADPVSDDELAAAIARSPDQPFRTATILAAYEGLRCCEFAVLDRNDVTEEKTHVKRGKGNKGRYVPTHPIVWDLVKDRPPGLLVVSQTGLPMTPARLSGIQHKHWASIGLHDIHWHRFRAWFATKLADEGISIDVIALLLGHKSTDTTRAYVRASVTRQQAAVELLPRLDIPTVVVSEHQPAVTRLVSTAA